MLAAYVKDHPNSSWGWYALGYSQFAQKKIGDSIKSLAESLSLNVKNPDAHKILGRDLMVVGRFDAAQTEYEQSIRYAPDSAENYYDLGKLFSLQDNWQAARKQFEEAVRLNPIYVEALDSLGFAQEALGDDADALQTYQKAIALNEQRHGKFVSAHVNLSAYYNRTGDSAKAFDFAQKALEHRSKERFRVVSESTSRGSPGTTSGCRRFAESRHFFELALVFLLLRAVGNLPQARQS